MTTDVSGRVRSPSDRIRPQTVAFDTAARQAAAETGPVAVSVFFYVVVVTALSGVWRFAADLNDGAVVGYSAVALTWYIATSEAVTLSLNVRMIAELGDDISSGSIAVELLRPAPVLWLRVATQLGRAVPRVAGIVPAGIAVCFITAGGPPSWSALALAAPSLVLALAANVVAQHLFAASAFWIRNATTAWYLYQKMVFVLGGMLIPLEVFPSGLEAVCRWLPFQAMAYAPARIASGHFEPWLIAQQVGWLVVLALLANRVFRVGEERLEVVGG